MFYHASKTPDIKVLTPHVSNDNKALLYFFTKRENTLVYLCNAVEKHCRQVGFRHEGVYQKWGSYGFTKDGVLRLEEYYPNATMDTYGGESGYIYSVERLEKYDKHPNIPSAVITECDAVVAACEYVPDAYAAIMKAVESGHIVLERFEDNSQAKLDWIEKSIRSEYQNADNHPEYREFLKAKFSFCL
jgi:hypothetical protein